jgi:hypothetical protein
MTDETNAKIEAELRDSIERELQAEMARKRYEIAARLRREREMAHYDKINRRHPIEDKYCGLGPKGYAARQEAMTAAARKTFQEMDEANARWAKREAAEREAARRASIGPGSEGFPQASEMEDSRGTLCRNRRLFGTLERLRCGWAGQDREGGEGRERARGPCLFLEKTWLSSESDWV